jgi:parallel beta-helix repeat protein
VKQPLGATHSPQDSCSRNSTQSRHCCRPTPRGTRADSDCRRRLELEGCDITSQSRSCVSIRNGADPRLHRNRIHDSKQHGVSIYDSGLGTLEDNDITANGSVGVEVITGGNPTLRRNRINRNRRQAVWIHGNGHGVIEDNDLTGNEGGPWALAGSYKTNVKRSSNRE